MVERVIRVFCPCTQWNNYCFGPLLREYSHNEEYIKKIFFKYGTVIGSATFSISARIQSDQANLPALKCLIVSLGRLSCLQNELEQALVGVMDDKVSRFY